MSPVSRVIKAPPETIHRACTDLASIAQWRVPDSVSGNVDRVDGATYRMSLTYPNGREDRFEATFIERVPSERIVEHIRFDALDRADEMTMTTSPLEFEKTKVEFRRHAPRIGEDGVEVLREAGLSDAAINRLRADKALIVP